jgi:hypothetical protein
LIFQIVDISVGDKFIYALDYCHCRDFGRHSIAEPVERFCIIYSYHKLIAQLAEKRSILVLDFLKTKGCPIKCFWFLRTGVSSLIFTGPNKSGRYYGP